MIVEIVGDSSGETTDALEPLRPAELLFHLELIRQIVAQARTSRDLVLRASHQSIGPSDHALRARLRDQRPLIVRRELARNQPAFQRLAKLVPAVYRLKEI